MSFLADHPLVLPALVGLVVLATALSGRLARRLGCGRLAAGVFVLAIAAPVAITLLPAGDAGSGYLLRWCNEDIRGPGRWGPEEWANLVLLSPLGVLAVLLLRRSRAVVVLVSAALLPLFVEVVQYAVPLLGRECDYTDLVLNLAGLGAGAGLGALGRWLRRAQVG